MEEKDDERKKRKRNRWEGMEEKDDKIEKSKRKRRECWVKKI